MVENAILVKNNFRPKCQIWAENPNFGKFYAPMNAVLCQKFAAVRKLQLLPGRPTFQPTPPLKLSAALHELLC